MNEESTKVITGGVSHLQNDFDYTMNELTALCEANNMEVKTTIIQNLDRLVAATYFGSGKVEEIKHVAEENDVKIIVINDELSPSQIRNLEKQTGLNVIDRTELILQVFASRAKTKQAKLQVEIAQLQYELPRIHPSGNPLDQQRGGSSATRGSGETKLELDRRVIRNRITALKKQLLEVDKNLDTQSQKRKNNILPTVALVGYTNAGKSTTMNALLNKSISSNEDSKVFEKDMLFATLDTSVRNITLSDNTNFLLSDTVGFVSKLPHNLVESFKTTLSEAKDADLIIHVVDYSDPNSQKNIEVTEKTLKEIGVLNKPTIIAYNKSDLANIAYPSIEGENIYYSAIDEKSISLLIKLIKDNIYKDFKQAEFLIPFNKGDVTSYIQNNLEILSKEYLETGTKFKLNLNSTEYQKLANYLI
ncbi:GTPase HflX [Companilactobacillus sp. DQM5]|uniref:GTPase HflX n=1 Tax=Companilactobacillus sp. DQM5 TaxID=3463359 RepID=UPI0040586C93